VSALREAWPLSPSAARVFYNAADAWGPDGPDDAVAALSAQFGDPRVRARLECALRWLEWSPRLLLHARHGFSWMERDARRAWLERLERRGPPPLRGAAARVRRAVEAVRHNRRQSFEGA
jgi:hypothetical protein